MGRPDSSASMPYPHAPLRAGLSLTVLTVRGICK